MQYLDYQAPNTTKVLRAIQR